MYTPSKLALALLSLAASAATGQAQAADYKYWYDAPDFGHQAGQLTNGNAAIAAPAWACARRFLSGVELQWIGDDGAGIAPDNGGQRINNSKQCRVAQELGADGDAYKACDRARRLALMAQQALKTVVEEMH